MAHVLISEWGKIDHEKNTWNFNVCIMYMVSDVVKLFRLFVGIASTAKTDSY